MSITIITKTKDVATCIVLDWLVYLGQDFNSISTLDFTEGSLSIKFSSNNSPRVYYNNKELSISNKWIRRYIKIKTGSLFYEENFGDFIFQELKSFQIGFLSALCKYGNKIGTNSQYLDPMNVNKIHVLLMARELGLAIPRTLISNDIKEIASFIEGNNQSIIKPLSQPLLYLRNNKVYKSLTKIVTKDDPVLQHIKFPTFFQEYINKDFEIRAFYFNNNFYCTAIFSQLNRNTQIDYRNYDDNNPNRIVPYILCKDYEFKLKRLMETLGLNTGSIDLIQSPNGEIYFLEVNPVGQFSGNLDLCNYNIHYDIAKYLSE